MRIAWVWIVVLYRLDRPVGSCVETVLFRDHDDARRSLRVLAKLHGLRPAPRSGAAEIAGQFNRWARQQKVPMQLDTHRQMIVPPGQERRRPYCWGGESA